MWLFCCGMLRSGSTLQFELASAMVVAANAGVRVEHHLEEKFDEIRDKYAETHGWKVFKCHRLTPAIRAEIEAGNAKLACTFRDVRDVAVSYMAYTGRSFTELVRGKLIQKCLTWYEEWAQFPDIYRNSYENIRDDVRGEVDGLARHLGIDLPDETRAEIVRAYAFESHWKRAQQVVEQGVEGCGSMHQTGWYHFLDLNHVTDGAVGKWRHRLNNRQVSWIERIAGDWLVEHGYSLSGIQLHGIGRLIENVQFKLIA